MLEIKNWLNNKTIQQLLDIRNIALIIFGVIVLAIAWSGAKTVQNNYQLQKQIAALQQQNDVMWLQNGNIYLQNQFYGSDEYLELSARQNLGLAAPGEKVMLVPKDVAMKYVDPGLVPAANPTSTTLDNRSKITRDLEAWRDFLLGRAADAE